MALLAALITEHKLLTGMLEYPSASEQIIGLLDAQSCAARALAVWRAAGRLS